MPAKTIVIRGARTHNLKNVTVEIPQRQLTVISGPSGSGKSSLAFNTLYAEGQRRFVESMSTYVRQFLERIDRPDVDEIEGILPAIAIEQKNSVKNARSTVATATELADHLRLFMTYCGETWCPDCGVLVRKESPQSITGEIVASLGGKRVVVLAPIFFQVENRNEVFKQLIKAGFYRAWINGQTVDIKEADTSAFTSLELVITRLRVDGERLSLITEAIEQAFEIAKGTVNILEGPFRDGMAATAIRSENVVLSTDVASDARMREALVATRGWDFHASAAIPFRLRGRTVGVLVLISKHAGLFEAAAEVHLLEEMGLDVSFALDSMAAEAERAIAEEDARKELVGRRQAEQAHRFVVASNHALIHGEDQESLLLEVCDVAVGIAGYQCAWIGTVDYQDITSLTLLSSTGDYPELVRWIREHGLPADSPGGRAVRSRTPVFIGDLSAPGLPEVAALATSMGLRSLAVLPLNGFQDQVVGVLFVYSDKSDAFDAREQELMAALAEDLSFGLRHLTSERLRTESERELLISGERLDRLTLQVVEAMGRIVELRDPYTQGHEYGVAALSVAIGTEMGLSEDVLQGLRVAGLLHDIGKMAIPSEILVKPGRLTEVEMTLVQSHVRFSYDMLKGIDFPWPVADAVLQHHERADGSGYPNRLSGDAIMLESRVLAVADVLEAMSGHRPYRPAMGLEAALQELVGHSEAYDRDVLAAVEQLSKVGALDYLDHRTTDVVASAQGARIAQGASSGRTMR